MKLSELGHMAIPTANFWSFITELIMRNQAMGIPPLDDGLFVNLVIFNDFQGVGMLSFICWGKRSNGFMWVMSTGIHKFGLLTHMAIIKTKNQRWGWLDGRVFKISLIRE